MDKRVGAQGLDDLHAARQGMPVSGRNEMLGTNTDDDFAPLQPGGLADAVPVQGDRRPAVERDLAAADRAFGEVHGGRADEAADEDAGGGGVKPLPRFPPPR